MLLKTLKSGSNKLLAPPLACSNVPVLCTVPSEGRRWHRWHQLQGCATLLVHTLKRPRKDETKRCRRTKKKCSSCGLASHHEMMMTDPGGGGQGNRGLPQILANQLTLFKPPHYYLLPRIFRPYYGPDHEMMMTEETCVLSRDIALEFKPRLLPTVAVC